MRHAFTLTLLLAATTVFAQTDITTTMSGDQATQVVRIAVPFPELNPPGAAAPQPVDATEVRMAFFGSLTRDIAYSGIMALAPLPPGVPVTGEVLKRINAQLHLQLNVWTEGEDYRIDARLVDPSGATQLRKLYRSPKAALTRTAHMLSNEIVKTLNGRPSVFLTQIVFASNRTGNWEIWLMDWDGANQRRITNHGALSILPSWSPDNERMVYTSFARGTSDMYIINRRGGGRSRVHSNLALNTSATFSPIGNDIAFVERPPPHHHRLGRVDAGVESERAADLVHLRPQRLTADLRHGRGRDERAPHLVRRRVERRRQLVAGRREDRVHVARQRPFPDPHRQPDHQREPHRRGRRVERAADLVARRAVDRISVEPQRTLAGLPDAHRRHRPLAAHVRRREQRGRLVQETGVNPISSVKGVESK
jgi:hypothetical protein